MLNDGVDSYYREDVDEEDARGKCSLKCWKARIERSICSGFAHKCISSWASVDKTRQSYFSNNSLFRTFPVTDDDAYTRTCASATNYLSIQKYKTVLMLAGQYWKVPSTNYNCQMVLLSERLFLSWYFYKCLPMNCFTLSRLPAVPAHCKQCIWWKRKKGRKRQSQGCRGRHWQRSNGV